MLIAPAPTNSLRARGLTSLAITLALSIATASGADDFVVSSIADDGMGSLREAVVAANASNDTESRITFSPVDLGTLTIDSSLANIAQDLTIDGNAATPMGLLVRGPDAGTALYQLDAGAALTLVDTPFDLGDVVLGDSSRVFFDTSLDQTVNQTIRDLDDNSFGSLEKLGAGELTLTGANSYKGGTTVSAGTLVVTSTSLPPGNTLVDRDATLAFDEDSDETMETPVFASILFGAGGIEKRGTAKLKLTGFNTYAGGTSVLEGVLIGGPTAIRGNVDVADSATLELIAAGGMDETFAGVLSGPGTLDKSGPDRLILTGSNSIAILRVMEGVLAGDVASLSGDVSIDAGAVLEINSNASGTIAGDLSGAGSIEKRGVGVVGLSGDVTDAAELRILFGRLVGRTTASLPSLVDITTPGVLTLNPTTDSVYSGTISGTGAFEKRGLQRLELDTAHTFTGKTDIRNGQLHLTGSLASNVFVFDKATLSGSGNVGGLVTNFGTIGVTPSARLSMGALTLTPGSQLAVSVEPSLSDALVSVTNEATFDPTSSLEVTLLDGDYSMEPEFTIVSATTLVGTPEFDDPFLFFDIDLSPVDQKLVLSVKPNNKKFEDFAANRNQVSVARSLDIESESATLTDDLEIVIDAIKVASAVPDAYDILGGEQISQLATARLELGEWLDRSLQRRMREHGDALRMPPTGSVGKLPAVSSGREPLDTVFWLEPFGVFGKIDGRRGAHDTDYTLAGTALGVDLTPLAGTRVGAAFMYGHTRLGYDSLSGSGAAHSYLGALYGGWSNHWLRFDLTSRLGYSDMETTRGIDIGTLHRTARAEFAGLDAGGRFEAGAKLLRSDRYLVEPFVSVDYVHLERGQVNESGADSVNLRASREKLDSVKVGAGLRARAIFRLDQDLVLIPELHGEWSQQLADRSRRVDASFQDAFAGSSFRVYGTELPRNAGLAGIAWTVRSPQGLSTRFGYDVSYDADRVAHAIGVTVDWSW